MKSLLLKVTTLVLIASVPVLGQFELRSTPRLEDYRFDFTGGGARAEGMGKAYIGVSDDNTAGSWNPAGLYELEKPIISLSYSSLLPRGYSDGLFILPGQPSRIDHEGSINNISGLDFVAPVRLKGHPFVGSFSYTRNFNDYQEMLASGGYDVIYSYDGIRLDTMTTQINLTSVLKGGMNSVNFGLGTRIYNNISAGVVLNVYTGVATREETMTNFRLDRKNAYAQFVRQDTNSTTLDSNKFSGYNFTVGFKMTGEQLSAGLVIRTPFDLTVNTGRSIYDVNQYNGLTIDAGTDTTYFDDIKLKYQMPIMVGFGIAYKLDEATTFAADAEYRAYSGKKIRVRDSIFLDPGGSNTEYYTDVNAEWKNVMLFRAGIEHLMEPDFAKVPLRAGFGYVPLEAQNLDISSGVLDFSRAKTVYFSGGAGLWWDQIHFDVAYTYSTMDWDYGYIIDHYPVIYGAVPFTQKSRDHHITATFTGYF